MSVKLFKNVQKLVQWRLFINHWNISYSKIENRNFEMLIYTTCYQLMRRSGFGCW